ncbi:MAG: hypothetical protein J6K17_05020 [Oscillospiraceae bacterium]|nr:hypothetical protein [Oscillospiraceae bacterium]
MQRRNIHYYIALGHQSFAVTADLYSHLYSDAFNPAANSINDTLSDIF